MIISLAHYFAKFSKITISRVNITLDAWCVTNAPVREYCIAAGKHKNMANVKVRSSFGNIIQYSHHRLLFTHRPSETGV
jgi:hypothetical protein